MTALFAIAFYAFAHGQITYKKTAPVRGGFFKCIKLLTQQAYHLPSTGWPLVMALHILLMSALLASAGAAPAVPISPEQ